MHAAKSLIFGLLSDELYSAIALGGGIRPKAANRKANGRLPHVLVVATLVLKG